MNDEKYKIVEYNSSYFNSFKLLSLGFPEFQPYNFIYHTKKIFENLYRGFGHNDCSSLLLIDNRDNSVVGFRGVIPSLYQIPLEKNKYQIIKGNGITGWLIKKDKSIPKGFGLKLNKKALENVDITVATCFGGEISLEVHKMNKFNIIDNLHRYIIPLNILLYKKLINAEYDPGFINNWEVRINNLIKNRKSTKPIKPNAETLESLWKKISSYIKILGLYKNKDYWNWRYLDCPYHNYLFFGDADSLGVIIARIESIFKFKGNASDTADKSYALHNKKVLRIIEILPANKNSWRSQFEASFYELLLSVIKWAREKGCIAVDYQFSGKIFQELLIKSEFKVQSKEYLPNECSLAGLFQPLIQKVYPINVAWKISNKEILDNITTEFFPYFVKSDVAGDYPKYWPKVLD